MSYYMYISVVGAIVASFGNVSEDKADETKYQSWKTEIMW